MVIRSSSAISAYFRPKLAKFVLVAAGLAKSHVAGVSQVLLVVPVSLLMVLVGFARDAAGATDAADVTGVAGAAGAAGAVKSHT